MADEKDDAKGVSRRGFLRGAGAGAVVVAGAGVMANAMGAEQKGCKTAGCDYDVVVIGGGFAGVTAARDCRKNGYKTLVLEARNRLGGRTFSTEFAGHKVELGGTWIHWTQPFVWAETQRYGLKVIESPERAESSLETMVILAEGKRTQLAGEELLPVLQAFDTYFADARDIWERPYDSRFRWNKLMAQDSLSARDRLDQLKLNPVHRAAVDSYLVGMSHCPSDQASYNEMARWWALPGYNLSVLNDSLTRYTFKDGTISLINAMIEDGKPEVRLSTPVKKVEDKGDHVVVTTQKGERIVAGSVVLALPMNVLPNIEFSPALDPKLIEAAHERHAGTGVKAVIKVKGKVGGEGKLYGLADSDHPLNVVFTYAKAEDHTLFIGFGDDPAKLDVLDRDAVQQVMQSFFPEMEVEDCFGYDWNLDPYSREPGPATDPAGTASMPITSARLRVAACSSPRATTARVGADSSTAPSAGAARRPCSSRSCWDEAAWFPSRPWPLRHLRHGRGGLRCRGRPKAVRVQVHRLPFAGGAQGRSASA